MNHAQLRSFHAVAQAGGFTAAGRAIGLTQPAVTVQVKALETSYGVELFFRQGRGVRLTRAGEELFTMTRRLFALEDEARDFLEAEGDMSTGVLHLAADGPFHIITLVHEIRRVLPKLEVKVSIGNSANVRDALLDYQAEIGVLGGDVTDKRFSILSARRHPVILMMAADHPWAERAQVHIKELDGQPMILREAGSGTRRSFEKALKKSRVRPNHILEIGSREAVREAVAAGLGLSVVQAPELGADTRIASCPIEGQDISTGEAVVCLRERLQSPLIRRITSLIEEL